MKIIVAILPALLIMGCAPNYQQMTEEQNAYMRSFVGKTDWSVLNAFGIPTYTLNVNDSIRAFIYKKDVGEAPIPSSQVNIYDDDNSYDSSKPLWLSMAQDANRSSINAATETQNNVRYQEWLNAKQWQRVFFIDKNNHVKGYMWRGF